MLAKERRTRLIRFRVSPDEYERLSRFCTSSGARSLSDLARSALQQSMRGQSPVSDPALVEQLRRVDEALREISHQMADLKRLLSERLAEDGNRNHVMREQK